jgi:hypothetical protein
MKEAVLTVWQELLRKEHPSTLTSMSNLALVLRNQGKCEQVDEMHRQELGLHLGSIRSRRDLWRKCESQKCSSRELLEIQQKGRRA